MIPTFINGKKKLKSISFYDFYLEQQQQQSTSASVSAISDAGKYIYFSFPIKFIYFEFESNTDAASDQRFSPSTLLNKSTSDLLSLAHLSSSQTPLSSSISITTVSQVIPYYSLFKK